MEPLRPQDPRQIGSYLLLARIGSGGMGEVFLARSPGGRAVAVKVIHAMLANDPEFRARFAREVAAARAVTGAFTAPVIDADPDAVRPWLATAFLPGMSLEEAVNGYGPWPPPAVYLLGVSLAEALGAIHRAGVVHRDLKPSNILLTPEGPRVIDFGIARAADAGTITHTGAAVGSPSYMAPEQATGGDTGPPGDVFSLGAVLTYAATGTAPFGGGSIPQLVYRIVHEQPYLGAVTDPGLQALITDCLEKDPERRPTAARVLERLASAPAAPRPAGPYGNHIHGIGWLPPPVAANVAYRARIPLPFSAPVAATAPRGGGRSIGRRGLLIGGAAAAATLAVAGTAAAFWSNRPRSPVLWKFEVPEFLSVGPKVAGDTVYVAGQETFALDPRTGKVKWREPAKLGRNTSPVALDGKVLFYDGGSLNAFDAATGRRLWSESIKTFALSPLPVATNGVVCMTAAPGAGEYVLYAIDVATGQRRWQYEAESLLTTNAAAHNGVFYLGSGAELLYAVDAGGRLRWQQPVGDKVASTPVVAGGLVYVTTQRYEVLAFDAATGRRRWRNATGAVASSGSAPRDDVPIVAGGLVYVRGQGGNLRALDARTGRERWTFSVGDKATAPIITGGLAVVHDGEGTLYALDTGRGKARWTQRLDLPPNDKPTVANGILYAAAGGDGVFGFEPAGGRVTFRMDDAAFPDELSPYARDITALNGILYCAVGSKQIYAIRPTTTRA